MNIFLIVALLSLVPIGLVLLFLYRTLSPRAGATDSVGLDQISLLSPERYRPMERLLRADDFLFLAAQPGFTPKLGRKFRTERRQIFRGYLRHLRQDFGQVSLAVQTLLVHAAEDCPDLASALVRQRLLFAAGMVAVEIRLLLHAAGLNPEVEVHGLIEQLKSIQTQMGLLLAIEQAAGAAA